MTNSKFKKDLEMGEAFEARVLEKLTSEGWGIIKNPDVKGMDFILTERGAECKFDIAAQKWGNAYIEYEAYGKPSGIMKPETLQLTWWIHSIDESGFMMFHGKIFRRWVVDKIEECENNSSKSSKGFRITSGGDGNRTKGLLVPITELKKQAYKTYLF